MEYLGIRSQIRKNNIRSTVLLVLFPCIVVALTWVFFFILSIQSGSKGYDSEGNPVRTSLSDITYTVAVALPWVLGACAVWFIIAYFINTSMIKKATHAHSLERKENKRVYNIVENLCIANGMKMPKLNVVEDSSLNAFASGINDSTYTVTLSRGIIDKLDDAELEAVIAHELTHIRNRDVRLMIISIVFVGIFAFISQLALRSLWRVGGKKDKVFVLVIVAGIIAAIGYLITTLMRFAISRKREYMADAGSAEMTKNPLALASALRKISQDSKIDHLEREDVAQLFIEHPSKVGGFFSGLFATHPPIEKRIAILEQF